MKNVISNLATRVSLKAQELKDSAKECLDNENGDFYVSEGVKVIIAVILGSLLITAMVALFNQQIIPGIATGEIVDNPYNELDRYQVYDYCKDEDKILIFISENKDKKLNEEEMFTSVIELLNIA